MAFRRFPVLAVTLVAASTPAVAQQVALPASPVQAPEAADGLHLSGSVRLRHEAVDGQARDGFNASDDLTSLRTQLKAVWRHGAIQLVAELDDSRAWGADPGTPLTTSEVNTFEPIQAYIQADLGAILGKGTSTSIQAGRFTMALGSRRLISNDEYRNAANGFTGLRADVVAHGGYKATVFYVLPQIRLPDDGPSLRSNASALDEENFATVLWGGFLSHQRKGSPLLAEASFVHFGERDEPGRTTRDRSLNNFGLRLVNDPRSRHFDWGLEGIYQWGHISDSLSSSASRLDVSASFLRLQAGYTFPGAWKPHLVIEVDRASGDGNGSTYGRFDTLFGMRRADLAPPSLYGVATRTNLLSPGVRLEVSPSKRFDGFIGYRALLLADSHDAFSNTSVRDATGNSGSFAGHQFDLRLRYWLVPKYLRVEFDGVYLAKGRFLKSAPNAPADGDTRYASFNLTASF
jgi:hypothetical protein